MNIRRRIMAINYQLSEAKKMNRAIIISFPNDVLFLFFPQIAHVAFGKNLDSISCFPPSCAMYASILGTSWWRRRLFCSGRLRCSMCCCCRC